MLTRRILGNRIIEMAPGVGKTYSMLEKAHRRKERGTDVVVGFVECRGRLVRRSLADALVEALPGIDLHQVKPNES